MERIPLVIVGLEQSASSTNSYALVLKEKEGERQIIVIIGVFEAQSILLGIEDLESKRPLTHDLFHTMLNEFHITVLSSTISKVREGYFHSEIHCINEDTGQEYLIDSRTSDAIALAVRFKAPIYVRDQLLEELGIENSPNYIEVEEDELMELDESSITFERLPIYKLEEMIKEMLSEEKYEEAARIRDEIKRRQS